MLDLPRDCSWEIIIEPVVSSRDSITLFDTRQPPLYERPWINCDGIAAPNIARDDRRYQCSGIRIAKKEVDAPSANGIGLHKVEELPVSLPEQRHSEVLTMATDAECFGSQRMAQATDANIEGQILFQHGPDRLVPWKSDGDEIRQKGVREG